MAIFSKDLDTSASVNPAMRSSVTNQPRIRTVTNLIDGGDQVPIDMHVPTIDEYLEQQLFYDDDHNPALQDIQMPLNQPRTGMLNLPISAAHD